MNSATFTEPLLAWFDTHGRKHLPWQHPRSAYKVWISEIMLQQTQVATVIPYFERFMESFPNLKTLSEAPLDLILAHWSGLGYYRRARNIHKTAGIICSAFGGEFPKELTALKSLPGIGDSTAAAIASQAFNLPEAILDGNVKRVLARYFMIEGSPEQAQVKAIFQHHAALCMSKTRCADYTQAIMDLGALCCTRANPQCVQCPLSSTCKAFSQQRVLDFPFKKPKKERPLKKQQFLLLSRADDTIFLQRNPPKGIWGGLWCMPSIDMEADPKAYILNTYGLECLSLNHLLEIRHGFTHFQLTIQAYAALVRSSAKNVPAHNGQWFKVEELSQIGLAKPVKQIIEYYLNN